MTEVSSDTLMKAASREVDRLTRRSRRDRIVQIVLAIVVVGLGGLMWQSRIAIREIGQESNQLRQASYRACVDGNSFKARDQQIWDSFIGLAVSNSTNRHAREIVKPFLAKVAEEDTQRPCSAIYRP